LYWICAGAIAAFTAGLHLIAGHRAPLCVMLQASFEEVSKRTMHAVWHIVTVALFLSAIVLLAAGLWPARVSAQLPAFVGAHYALYTLVFLVIALAAPLERGLWKLPQWTLFVPIAALSFAGYA
jgi:hypothetical protein